jgi:hypothetical protein
MRFKTTEPLRLRSQKETGPEIMPGPVVQALNNELEG